MHPLVELRRWSGSDFPLHCDYQTTLAGRATGVHTHDGVELVYIVKGSGIEVIGGISYPIIVGDLYVIDVGATHAFSAEAELEFFNLIFQPPLFTAEELAELGQLPEFSRFFLPGRRDGRAKLTLPPAAQERVAALFSRLTRELVARRPGHRLIAKALFIDLVVAVCRLYREDQDPAARADGPVARALGHIHEHYHEPLSVDVLASLVCLSPGHFGEVFKARTGTNVLGYINRVRIDRARAMLESSQQSITDIALTCGFDDVGYFARVFKKVTGQTPSEHRRGTVEL